MVVADCVEDVAAGVADRDEVELVVDVEVTAVVVLAAVVALVTVAVLEALTAMFAPSPRNAATLRAVAATR